MQDIVSLNPRSLSLWFCLGKIDADDERFRACVWSGVRVRCCSQSDEERLPPQPPQLVLLSAAGDEQDDDDDDVEGSL